MPISITSSTEPFSVDIISDSPPSGLEMDTGATGQITIGGFTESFAMAVSYWGAADYRRSWHASLTALLREEDSRSCLVTSITDPTSSNFVFSWPLFRAGDIVFVQNWVIFLDELEEKFDPDAPWASVGPRTTVNEDGDRISEWQTTTAAIRAFLEKDPVE